MLEKRVLEFEKQDYEENKELFEKLGKGQNPHTLFISCTDSRVVPTMLTRSKPGELFILRNIANIIPPYKPELFAETISGVEYAVLALGVKNIIICGHSDCGGCAALYEDLDSKDFAGSKRWLALLSWVSQQFKAEKDLKKRALLTEQTNLINSYANLSSYPFIEEKKPKISLWYYEISSGKVSNYDFDKSEFFEITRD